jgi:hypothetical protein
MAVGALSHLLVLEVSGVFVAASANGPPPMPFLVEGKTMKRKPARNPTASGRSARNSSQCVDSQGTRHLWTPVSQKARVMKTAALTMACIKVVIASLHPLLQLVDSILPIIPVGEQGQLAVDELEAVAGGPAVVGDAVRVHDAVVK